MIFIAVPMMKVQTVAGMLTNLPCNITPSGQFQLPVPNIEINLKIYFNKRKLKFYTYMYVQINKNRCKYNDIMPTNLPCNITPSSGEFQLPTPNIDMKNKVNINADMNIKKFHRLT